MKVKAQKSFAGAIAMHKGQEMDVEDTAILEDLIANGYVTSLEKVVAKKTTKTTTKKKTATTE